SEEGLVSNWDGEAIYNASDENLGSVDDLLLTEDGQIKAVVVGVGGFLGIGKKSVAIAIDAIEPRTDENGDLSLYVTASAEQLDGAPTFKTQAELLAEARCRGRCRAGPPSARGPAVPTN
ncbi:MAG: photosystem reaction center subunit H, partial [Bauldia sp.]